MEVYGKNNIKKKTFKDLNQGDVFFFINDYDSYDFTKTKVYMRCGHTGELAAVNLETGICYTFEKDLAIEVLNATLHIEEDNLYE